MPSNRGNGTVWRFGEVELDERSLTLRVAGRETPIERKPLELLILLLQHRGEVVTKEEIFDGLWPGRVVVDGALTNCVRKLRLALGAGAQQAVQTVRGYGYRLVAEVEAESRGQPVAPGTPRLKPGDTPPHRPHWHLETHLGTGGHGEVWLAEHDKLGDRRVFKFALDNAAALASLKREIMLHRLLRSALLDQGALLTLLDWNVGDPPYFIETEYLPAGNIADWAEARGGLTAIPLAERIELIAQAADALAAAHALGVLHKDLKPGNLLIDDTGPDRPCIKLCDFGSGLLIDARHLQALDITRVATTQALAADSDSGTPLYLAPELLAGGTPTVQADIYALGVMLYQAIAGDFRKPLAPGWQQDVNDELLCEDVAAAAAGNPAHRLADARLLARRLRSLAERRREREHERRREQEEARLRERVARSEARRRPLQVLALTFFAAAVASGVLLWQQHRQSQRLRLETARERSVMNFLEGDLLSPANPMISQSRNVTMREALDAASTKLDTEFASEPLVRARLERVVGTAYAAMLDRKKAVPLLLAAEKTLASRLGDAAAETEATRLALRNLYLDEWDVPDVLAVSRRIDHAERRAGVPNPGAEFEARAMLASMPPLLHWHVFWLTDLYKPMHALYEQARHTLGPTDKVTLRLLWYSGVALSWAHRYAQALPLHRAAYEGLQKIYGPRHPRTLEVALYLAEALNRTGRAKQALPLLEKMIGGFQRTLGPDHPFMLHAKELLAQSYERLGQPAKAVTILKGVYQRRITLLGNRDIHTQDDVIRLSDALAAAGRSKDAKAQLESLLALQQSYLGDDAPQVWRTRDRLGAVLDALHEDKQAAVLLRLNLEQVRARVPKENWFLGHALWRLGSLLASDGDTRQARELLQQAASIDKVALGANDPQTRRVTTSVDRLDTGVRRIR